jgi:hypothetical protein
VNKTNKYSCSLGFYILPSKAGIINKSCSMLKDEELWKGKKESRKLVLGVYPRGWDLQYEIEWSV